MLKKKIGSKLFLIVATALLCWMKSVYSVEIFSRF